MVMGKLLEYTEINLNNALRLSTPPFFEITYVPCLEQLENRFTNATVGKLGKQSVINR